MGDKSQNKTGIIVVIILVILLLPLILIAIPVSYIYVYDYMQFMGNRLHAFDYIVKNYDIEFSLVSAEKGAVSTWISRDVDDKFTFYDITNDRYFRLVYDGIGSYLPNSSMKDEYAIEQIKEKIGRELPKVMDGLYINSNLEIFDSSAILDMGMYREAYRNLGIYSFKINFNFSGGLSTSKERPFEFIYCDLSVDGGDPWTKEQVYKLFSFLKNEFPGLNVRFYSDLEEGIFSKFPLSIKLTDSTFSTEEEFYKVTRLK